MKVIVIGATGTVGRLAVDAMLKDGHQVTAFARHPDRLDLEHAALRRAPATPRTRPAFAPPCAAMTPSS